jgi:hypothetical protein
MTTNTELTRDADGNITGAVYPCDFCGGDAIFTRVYTERGYFWWLRGVNGSGITQTDLWCEACATIEARASSKGAN